VTIPFFQEMKNIVIILNATIEAKEKETQTECHFFSYGP